MTVLRRWRALSRPTRWGLILAAADFIMSVFVCLNWGYIDSFAGVLVIGAQLPGWPLAAIAALILWPIKDLPAFHFFLVLFCGVPGWYAVGYLLGRHVPKDRAARPARLAGAARAP